MGRIISDPAWRGSEEHPDQVFGEVLLYFGFGPNEAICEYLFTAAAIFAGHVVRMDNPMVSPARTLIAFPAIGFNELLILGYFH